MTSHRLFPNAFPQMLPQSVEFTKAVTVEPKCLCLGNLQNINLILFFQSEAEIRLFQVRS